MGSSCLCARGDAVLGPTRRGRFVRCELNQYIPYVIRRKPVELTAPLPLAKKPPPPFRVSPVRARMEQIIREEAEEHYTTPEEIMSKSRLRNITWARHDAIFRIYEEMNISTVRLGQFFGGRDHSTIVHAVQRGRWRRDLYIAVKMAVEGRLRISNI